MKILNEKGMDDHDFIIINLDFGTKMYIGAIVHSRTKHGHVIVT